MLIQEKVSDKNNWNLLFYNFETYKLYKHINFF